MLPALVILALVSSAYCHEYHPSLPRVARADSAEQHADYWYNAAQHTVNDIFTRRIIENTARNVILFIGDGMSVATIAAARVYLQGEEAQLSFEKFPYSALSKTYAVDQQVSDSANTATAYLCGIKANYGTIGLSPEVSQGDCAGTANTSYHVMSIAHHSQVAGKRTGLVTTARVTHASPAGVYAHTGNRDWESDTDVLFDNGDLELCPDIAQQLVSNEIGSKLNVAFGGGRRTFLGQSALDDEGISGSRTDEVDLRAQWVNLRPNQSSTYIWNRTELLNLPEDVDNVLGLFASDHMDYNLDRDPEVQPSLEEMTEAAIKILGRGDNGFFLFVEGARIDMGHHEGRSAKALDETIEFSKAIQRAVDLTNEQETLIVVTSDHAQTLSYSGYSPRGNDILGFSEYAADDGLVYSTLSYANGPGYKKPESNGDRYDQSQDNTGDKDYEFPAVAPVDSTSHSGEDVAIFARGPWAHLFCGVLEENVIPHLMSFAACLGDGLTTCNA